MDLRPGYKQTEVGVIPGDWEVVPLSELLEFRNGVNADKEAYGSGVPFINVLEVITKGHLSVSDIPGRVSLLHNAVDAYAVKRGDLVFNRTSETQEEVGLSAVYLDDAPVVFGGFVIRGRPTGATLDATYSGYAFRAHSLRVQIVARGQGAIRANIGQSDLRRVLAPLPPLLEQRAIAGVLGDADALIEALDRLIAKKRNLKQAAMQQLLTGQARLPGFSGEWQVKQLGDMVWIRNQKALPATVDADTICVELEDIGQGDGRLMGHSTARHLKSSQYRFLAGDVLFGRLRSYLRKFWLADRDGLCSMEIWPLMVDPAQISAGFLHKLVQTSRFTNIASVSYGTHMPRADWDLVRNFEVSLPPIPEQVAIASVLSDMDAEIAALEQRLAKTRALKQGMMQELLTGRIRLPVTA